MAMDFLSSEVESIIDYFFMTEAPKEEPAKEEGKEKENKEMKGKEEEETVRIDNELPVASAESEESEKKLGSVTVGLIDIGST